MSRDQDRGGNYREHVSKKSDKHIEKLLERGKISHLGRVFFFFFCALFLCPTSFYHLPHNLIL